MSNFVENVKTGTDVNLNTEPGIKNIVLAGGCFWGTQEFLNRLPGVKQTFTAYANGDGLDPSYQLVCTGDTDHVEAVYVAYDPAVIDLEHLLFYFFKSFDPRQKDRQANDIGRQYRNGIYYLDDADVPEIEVAVAREQSFYEEELVTEILPLDNISIAEEVHQDYLVKNPLGYCHVNFNNLPAANAPMVGSEFR